MAVFPGFCFSVDLDIVIVIDNTKMLNSRGSET